MSAAIWSCHRSWHVAVTVHVGHRLCQQQKKTEQTSATAEVISRGAVSDHSARYTAIMMDLALAVLVLQCCTVQYSMVSSVEMISVVPRRMT
jgi:hypothetical protein